MKYDRKENKATIEVVIDVESAIKEAKSLDPVNLNKCVEDIIALRIRDWFSESIAEYYATHIMEVYNGTKSKG